MSDEVILERRGYDHDPVRAAVEKSGNSAENAM
jgi:hypothetical protein